jgi:hypothetical protein
MTLFNKSTQDTETERAIKNNECVVKERSVLCFTTYWKFCCMLSKNKHSLGSSMLMREFFFNERIMGLNSRFKFYVLKFTVMLIILGGV